MTALRALLSSAALAGVLALTALTGCETRYGFDPVDVGSDEARTPRPRSNSQYLRSVYADVLGRSPIVYDFVVYDGSGTEVSRFQIDEQEFLLAAMDSYGDPRLFRSFVATGLVSSAEADIPDKQDVDDPEAFIREQFQRYLGREPGAYELFAFMDAWTSDDAVGPREIVRALIGSREYQSY